MNLFTVAQTNYSNRIVLNTYAVQKTDEFETWTDANLVTHKYAGRTRIKGSFSMRFIKKSDYDAFVTALANAKQSGGYYIAQLYCVNTNTTELANVIIDFAPVLSQKRNLQLDVLEFQVNIEEL